MTKRKILALIVATMTFISFRTASSQGKIESIGNDFGLTIGLTGYQIKEKALNNIKHDGAFMSGGLSYEISKKTSKQRFELYLTPSKVGSRYDPGSDSFIIDTAIKYRYAGKVGDINKNIGLFVGGIAAYDLHMGLYENWDEAHVYWSDFV